MRDDVALDDVVAELDGEGGRAGATTPPLLAEDGHGAAVVDATPDHVGGDLAQDRGAVGVEELDGGADHRADVSPGVDPALEERVNLGDLHAQPIAALRIPGIPLLLEDRDAMLTKLESLVPPPAAGVTCDLVLAVEQAHGDIVSDEGERLSA